MQRSGRLVILSGPSGVGKDTIIKAWSKADPRVHRVVAYTTRAPRSGEAPAVDYHFVTPAQFSKMAWEGAFLEHKEVHGNFYGTPLRDMEEILAAGNVAVLKIDVQGALEVMRLRPEAVSVFIMPPSIKDLETRMRERRQDPEEVIQKRHSNARAEMALAPKYSHIVVNDDVARVVAQLQEICEAEEAYNA